MAEDGTPTLKRVVAAPLPEGLAHFEAALADALPDRQLLTVLANVAHWTNYPRHFSPPSGGDSKLSDARERAIMTVFGYGCNLGPTQTTRHTRSRWTADMIATLNRQHVTVRKYRNYLRINQEKPQRTTPHVARLIAIVEEIEPTTIRFPWIAT
ncbi:Tn3 family transposase [Herpetosiphon geysericola]|uniref:Tn3 family transposase n=1 Tax=Herpetosiphon geysericola TaxID=70996 RepID=UPI0009F90E60